MFRTAPLVTYQEYEAKVIEEDAMARVRALENQGGAEEEFKIVVEQAESAADELRLVFKKSPVRKRDRVINFQWVLGMITRETKEIRFELTDHTKIDMVGKIRNHVAGGATIYTDAAMQYNDLYTEYNHGFINKAREGYVNMKVSTQRIENVWRQFRRHLRRLESVKRRKDLPFLLREIEWKVKHNGRLESALVESLTDKYAIEMFKTLEADDLWETIAVPQLSMSEKVSVEKMRREGETDEDLLKRLKVKGRRKVSRRLVLTLAPRKRMKLRDA
jgi:hypothetical protein